MMNSITRWGLVAAGAFALAGCNLDLQDPNLPTEENAISTRSGITQVAIGLQAEYSDQLIDPVWVGGLLTDELGPGGATFQGYQELDRGEPIDNDLGPSEEPWAGMYRVVRDADVLLENAPNVGFGPGTTSGIIALADFYKALALGNLILIYPQIPLDVGPNNQSPEFASRQAVMDMVLQLFQDAHDQLATTPPSSEFTATIVAPGFDLKNSIDAMTARFALAFGNYDVANTAAQRVDPSVFSLFEYGSLDANPLWNLWYNSGNAYQMRPEDQFRLEAEPGDQRVDYWIQPADITGANGPLDDLNQYRTRSDPYPVYMPDEMKLIRAEVAARSNDLATALNLVNQVRTQCSSAVAEPVACLPALTSADVPDQSSMLDEILHERRYELYLQGVRWSDLRRFGKPVPYQYMQVPRTECERNTNAPSDLCSIASGG